MSTAIATLSENEARGLIRRMFAAHSRFLGDLTETEYVEIILTANCEACAVGQIEFVRKEGRKVPDGPELRKAIAERIGTAEHVHHLGQGSRETQAELDEAFWRDRAAKLIAPHAESLDLARFIAAQMWWSSAVPANTDSVAAEMADEHARKVWIQSAFTFAHARGGVTPALVEAAFSRARRAATVGSDAMTEQELNL